MTILDMGETAIEEQIFEEYLAEMSEHYTADKVHSLPDNRPHKGLTILPPPCSIISWVMTISMSMLLSVAHGYPLHKTSTAIHSRRTASGSLPEVLFHHGSKARILLHTPLSLPV